MFQAKVEEWIENWNRKDIDKCATMLSDDIELRSTQLLKLFPDTNGVIKGKATALNYFSLIFKKFPANKLENAIIQSDPKSVIVSATNGASINSYVQYFFNSLGKLYLIKSDITDEKYNSAISA